MSRVFLTTTLIMAGTLAAAAEPDHPNFVFIMADDHGYGDTGFTGHPFVRTPHLDAMAQCGVTFNRFYAGVPVCPRLVQA